MTTKKIIFDDNGIDFMLMNIFGHDFVHDFNPVSMGNRLKKIKGLISQMNDFIIRNVVKRGGSRNSRKLKNKETWHEQLKLLIEYRDETREEKKKLIETYKNYYESIKMEPEMKYKKYKSENLFENRYKVKGVWNAETLGGSLINYTKSKDKSFRNKNPQKWDLKDVNKWLVSIGLSKYKDKLLQDTVFKEVGVFLLEITKEDLEKLKINNSEINKILSEIRKLEFHVSNQDLLEKSDEYMINNENDNISEENYRISKCNLKIDELLNEYQLLIIGFLMDYNEVSDKIKGPINNLIYKNYSGGNPMAILSGLELNTITTNKKNLEKELCMLSSSFQIIFNNYEDSIKKAEKVKNILACACSKSFNFEDKHGIKTLKNKLKLDNKDTMHLNTEEENPKVYLGTEEIIKYIENIESLTDLEVDESNENIKILKYELNKKMKSLKDEIEAHKEAKDFIYVYYTLICYYFLIDDKDTHYCVLDLVNDKDVINQLKLYLVTECNVDELMKSLKDSVKDSFKTKNEYLSRKTSYFDSQGKPMEGFQWPAVSSQYKLSQDPRQANRNLFNRLGFSRFRPVSIVGSGGSRTKKKRKKKQKNKTMKKRKRKRTKKKKQRKRTKKIKRGGADTDMTSTDRLEKIRDIKNFLGSQETKSMFLPEAYSLFVESADKQKTDEIQEKIDDLITSFKTDINVIKGYDIKTEYDDALKLIPGRRGGVKPNIPKRKEFFKNINEIVSVIYKKYLQEQKTLQRERKAANEKEKAQKKAAEEAKRLLQGDLSGADKDNVNNINLLVVSYVLQALGYVDDGWDGLFSSFKDNKFKVPITDAILEGEYDMLFNLIDTKKGLGGIDAALLDLFSREYTNMEKKEFDKKDKKSTDSNKSIINNAINLRLINGEFFCPLGSVMDGQPTCTYKTATQDDGFEYSDEYKFIITNEAESKYYSCIVKYVNDKTTAEIIIEYNLNGRSVNFINTKTNITTDKVLEANFVFPRLITSIINSWSSLREEKDQKGEELKYNDYWDYIFSVNMEEIMKIGPNKNFGDLFQEVSTVAKNGAMTGTKKNYIGNVSKYDSDGVADRLGLSGDRPSGLRIVYILKKALKDSAINTKAHGGYFGPFAMTPGTTSLIV